MFPGFEQQSFTSIGWHGRAWSGMVGHPSKSMYCCRPEISRVPPKIVIYIGKSYAFWCLSQKTVVFGQFWFVFFPRNHCKIEKNQKSASRKHAFSGTARNGRSRSTAFSDTFSRPLVFFALSCTRKRRTFSIFSLLQWFRRENGLRNHFFGDPAHVPKTPPWGGRAGICPRYIQRTPGVLSRVPREAPRKEERMEGRGGRKQRRTMRQGDSQFYIYKLPIDRQRGCYVI